MNGLIAGKVLKYGSNINTDIISPPQYMELSLEDSVPFTMSTIDPFFYQKVKENRIFVAEDNLGSGSSRETAPLMLKAAGVQVVIAKYFARIFYRNLINAGIPAIECEDVSRIQENNEVEIDLEKGVIRNLTNKEEYGFCPIPAHIMKIIQAGGLYEYLKLQNSISG